jgi:hypothetical protein
MFPVRMILYILKGLYYPKKVLAGNPMPKYSKVELLNFFWEILKKRCRSWEQLSCSITAFVVVKGVDVCESSLLVATPTPSCSGLKHAKHILPGNYLAMILVACCKVGIEWIRNIAKFPSKLRKMSRKYEIVYEILRNVLCSTVQYIEIL